MQETSGTLSVVSVTTDAEEAQLSPTVFVDMEVNDFKIAVLVDTGSPATIISLAFVLQILADQSLTPAQWKGETLKRFLPPKVALKRYGGHRVDIGSQTPLRLRLRDRCVKAVVFVQKDAPNQLLLETDNQPKLGIWTSVTYSPKWNSKTQHIRRDVSRNQESQYPYSNRTESTMCAGQCCRGEWRDPSVPRLNS